MNRSAPLIVGLGGTFYDDSISSRGLTLALAAANGLGARTRLLAGGDLMLPAFDPRSSLRDSRALALVEALRQADGVILGSPCYHGSVSGLVKNAIDYLEDLRTDARPYLHGRAIGVIAFGGGAQGAGTALAELRAIAHALRGTPVALGVAVSEGLDAKACAQIELMTEQVVELARLWSSARGAHAMSAPSAALPREHFETLSPDNSTCA